MTIDLNRAQRAIDALRKPDASLQRVPNTVRQSIAEVIEDIVAGYNRSSEHSRAWQPIETAPKDGTEIWAFVPLIKEQARMKWISGDGYALWVWADDLLNDADPDAEQPTHWRPLPTPPDDVSSPSTGK